MKSLKRGKSTSIVEVQNIGSEGLWILIDSTEYYLSYKDFPWFKNATVKQILKIERPCRGHLHWPELDVDLEIESISDTNRYPLVYL